MTAIVAKETRHTGFAATFCAQKKYFSGLFATQSVQKGNMYSVGLLFLPLQVLILEPFIKCKICKTDFPPSPWSVLR